jgi:mannose-1-phosphate guanylyltransferase
MKGLILAAGFGTRLGYLTQQTPKALIPVGGKSILDHNIRKLLEIGVSEILINTHYLSEQVEDFLEKQNYPAKLNTVFEPELLGTAGTLKANLDFFETGDFLVMHGDNYFTSNLSSLVNAHISRSAGTEMTMATFNTKNPELCGTVVTDSRGVVTEFFEKSKYSTSLEANAAIYIFSKNVIQEISSLSKTENDISNNLIPRLLGKIQSHRLIGEFIDIGSPLGLKLANDIFCQHQNSSKPY